MKCSDEQAQVVYVLQGGGALGAYQAGAFEALSAQDHQPDWVVGTSIGAINSAIIAGNPPEARVASLRGFWLEMAQADPPQWPSWPAWPQVSDWLRAGQFWGTLTKGIPGFFALRPEALFNPYREVSPTEASFYDTSALAQTLNRFVDFDLLNSGPTRCTVCAVDVETGELAVFDSARQRLDHRHIMASGALPPGFPAVEIDGRSYWDGGVYSNTPVDVVLQDSERRDTLCFMIDLWDPTEKAPTSIAAAMARQKDIQYASRTNEHLDDHCRMQNMRRAIRVLASQLPDELQRSPEIQRLSALGCSSHIHIVRLVMKAAPTDDANKDVDFAHASLKRRWQAGRQDAERALSHASWLAPMPGHIGMVIHELPQLDDA